MAIDADAAAIHVIQPAQQIEKSGFARAAGTNNSDLLSGKNMKAQETMVSLGVSGYRNVTSSNAISPVTFSSITGLAGSMMLLGNCIYSAIRCADARPL